VKIVVSRRAHTDLGRLHDFLIERNPETAQRAVEALSKGIQSLLQFPERGRLSAPIGAREIFIPFGQSAYVVRYHYSPKRDAIAILRIWHGRERRR